MVAEDSIQKSVSVPQLRSQRWQDTTLMPQHSSDMPQKEPSLKRTAHRSMDNEQRQLFLREMDHTREQLSRFKKDMDGLAMQMNSMSENLHASKDRVCEIEQDLLATQENNVNLQVLLERAVRRQKETDQRATQRIRHLHSNLSMIARESSQLQQRVASLEYLQQEHNGSVHDMVSRMQEYVSLLDQAQDTLYSMKHPGVETLTVSLQDLALFDSRRTSAATTATTVTATTLDTMVADDADDDALFSKSIPTQIVHKRASFPARIPASPPKPPSLMPFSATMASRPVTETQAADPAPASSQRTKDKASSSTSQAAPGLLLLLRDE
ncbi:hypothetical protein BC940DRAFT_291236 [Gongronella butleri]|nr:hypothetical protein BC940DRAFT_291236 [Gongronella butleri]